MSFIASFFTSNFLKKTTEFFDFKIILIIVLFTYSIFSYFYYQNKIENINKDLKLSQKDVLFYKNNNISLKNELKDIELKKQQITDIYENKFEFYKQNLEIISSQLNNNIVNEKKEKLKKIDTKSDFKSFFDELKKIEE